MLSAHGLHYSYTHHPVSHPIHSLVINSVMATDLQLPKNIGWIGLGLMGLPMATNILNKTDQDSKIYVFDVVQDAVRKFVEAGQGRVIACESSKEVTDKSVCHM